MTRLLCVVFSGLLLLEWSGRSLHGQSQPAESATTTVRTDVRLVAIDVTVADKQGAPVKGLKPEDFQLKEDNVLQKIASVDDHGDALGTSVDSPVFPAEAGATVLSNRPLHRPIVWNVLLVDLLNTRVEDQVTLRKHIQQFAKGLPSSQPLALIGMSAQMKLLVPFEAGAGGIAKALDKTALSPNHSPLLDIYNSDDEALLAKMLAGNPTMSSNVNARMLNTVKGHRDSVDLDRQGQRVETTLQSFSELATWLKRYPGRKNVYWLSSGFPLQGEPAAALGGSGGSSLSAGNYASQFAALQQDANKELETARIAIYPIDVRGVFGGATPGVDDAGTGGYLFVKNPSAMADQEGKFDRIIASEQAEMLDIAKATGGVARFNNNDVAGILYEDFSQSQTYYTLSYTPSRGKWDGSYRKIDIGLQQKGYHLVYRRGYYAKELPRDPKPTSDQFTMALRHGAPAESSIVFSAKLRKTADTVNVEYAIDLRTLQFQPDSSGSGGAAVDCAIVEYDAAGKVMGTSQIRVTGKVKPEQFVALNAISFPAKQSVPLLPGAASLALGVRDESTGRFGNMEVVLAAK